MKKCTIYYHTLTDEMRKEDKLEWFSENKIQNIPFEHIQPDKNNNWLDITDNDWETMIEVCSKEVKSGKIGNALFELFSNGIVTARDEWTYDFDSLSLENKTKYFIDIYNSERNRWLESDKKQAINNFVNREIKWTEELEAHLKKGTELIYNNRRIVKSLYRPFIVSFNYYDKIITHRIYQQNSIFPIKDISNNVLICFQSGNRLSFCSIVTNFIPNYAIYSLDPAQCLPLYRYDSKGNRLENITDWGLEQFQNNYSDKTISKEDIFNYVYAVLHNPQFRKKYELNLKREFPRIPFYDDFWEWSAWGKKLIDLHINFETVEPFPINISNTELVREVYKPKLKANKETGEIYLDNITTLSGIPAEVWDYKLGNRSALEWILDQYKEKKPKDPTIAEKFNTYKFIDHKEKVIDLLMRVTTVSIETMKIIKKMDK